MSRVEELLKARDKQLADRAAAKEAQFEKDLEARIELEAEFGQVVAIDMPRFVPGQPTQAFVRTPDQSQYKRYKSQVYAAAQKKPGAISVQEAQELLAKACWCYPKTQAERDEMLDAFPGLLTPLSTAAAFLAEGKSEDEGKG
jgi:predicted RNase H-like nuclease